jgi:hypothetical protein
MRRVARQSWQKRVQIRLKFWVNRSYRATPSTAMIDAVLRTMIDEVLPGSRKF